MATPVYRNPWHYELAVPTYVGSSVIVPPGKLVKGSYYQGLADLGILELYEGLYDPIDVIYVYPGEFDGGVSGSSTITGITAGDGLTGGGTSGVVTLAVATGGITSSMLASDAVTASNVASGQLVKSLNGLFDDIILAVGENMTITPVGQTVTLAAPFAVTVLDDKGAVALQTGTLTAQTGSLSVTGDAVLGGLLVGSDVDVTRESVGSLSQLISTFDTASPTGYQDGLIVSAKAGYTTTPGEYYEVYAIEAHAQTLETQVGNFSSLIGMFATADHRGAGSLERVTANIAFSSIYEDAGSVIDVTGLAAGWSIGGSVTNAYGLRIVSGTGTGDITNAYGLKIDAQTVGTNKWNLLSAGAGTLNVFEGSVNIGTSGYVFDPSGSDSYVNAELEFKKPVTFTDTGTISLSNYTGTPRTLATVLNDSTSFAGLQFETQTTDTSVVFWKAIDGDTNVLSSLIGNKLYAQVGAFDKLSAGATLVTTGDYNLANYTGATYVCDCTAGAVTFTLPEIVPDVTLSGETYIFTKSDVTTNNVLISGQQGQTINGSASYLLTTRWQSVKIMAIIGPGPTPLTFWVTV